LLSARVASEYKYIHLTNYCQQKYAPSFEKFEAGNTLSFADFAAYLAAVFPGTPDALEAVIMPQIKRIVCDTFRSLQGRGSRSALCSMALTPLPPSLFVGVLCRRFA
jgi:hypothetical protein